MTVVASSAFAEVIESSLTGWCAQSWQWDHFARFGSLVTSTHNTYTLFGIVHQVETGSIDPSRSPFPFKKTEEELKSEQPQIFEYLRTTFSCLTVGYREKGRITYQLAPMPAKIHSFVEPAKSDLAKEFFACEHYLHLLFGASGQETNLDELLLALLCEQQALGLLSKNRLEQFAQTYSLLTGSDYRRMKLFLQRAGQALEI